MVPLDLYLRNPKRCRTSSNNSTEDDEESNEPGYDEEELEK
jgi:hypothetical protein